MAEFADLSRFSANRELLFVNPAQVLYVTHHADDADNVSIRFVDGSSALLRGSIDEIMRAILSK